ncbi:MAG: glycosyltransferase [Nitrospirota bacterium]
MSPSSERSFDEVGNPPIVSIVIPAYNHENYVLDCIQSVLEQDYPRIDLIVINDGSTDDTDKKIRNVLERDPSAFQYISKANEGLVKTLNLGLKLAKGQYFCELASDDFLLPGSIVKRADYLNLHPEIDVVFADAYLLNGSVRTTRRLNEGKKGYSSIEHTIKDLLDGKAKILFPSGMFRKSMLEQLGGFDEAFRDYEDVAMRLLLTVHARIGYLDEPVMFYRKHATNTSSSRKLSLRREKILALEKLLDLGMQINDTEDTVKRHLYREYVRFMKLSLRCPIEGEQLLNYFKRAIKIRPLALKVWYYFILSRFSVKTK